MTAAQLVREAHRHGAQFEVTAAGLKVRRRKLLPDSLLSEIVEAAPNIRAVLLEGIDLAGKERLRFFLPARSSPVADLDAALARWVVECAAAIISAEAPQGEQLGDGR
jgi:hypothetical protein